MLLTRVRLTLFLLVFAAPARADISPEQVRDVLLSGARDAGLSVTVGSEVRSGDRLTLSDITATASGEGGSLTASLPQLTLRDNGAGAVEVTMAPEISLRGIDAPTASPRKEFSGQVTQTGFAALVSGQSDDLTIAVKAAGIDTAIDTLLPGATAATDNAEAGVKALAATLHLNGVGPKRVSADLTADSLDADIKTNDGAAVTISIAGLAWTAESDLPDIPPGGDFPGLNAKGSLSAQTLGLTITPPADELADNAVPGFTLRYAMTGFSASGDLTVDAATSDGPSPVVDLDMALNVASTTSGTDADPASGIRMSGQNGPISMSLAAHVPQGADDLGLSQALAAGLRMSARFDAAAGTSSAAVAQPDLTLSYDAVTGPGRMEFALSSSGAVFDLSQTGFSLALASPELPAPVSGSVKELAFRFAFPVTPSERAEPFVLSQRIVDLTLADGVWDLFDPGKTMTRRPMTLISDISGTARVLRDVFADDTPDDLPFFPETLDITALTLALGPAEVAATGSLTFSGTPQAPKAGGRINATLKGVYALMNEIGATGLAPPEVFLGLRGGLAVITKAVGPDDLVSDVEFRPDGTIWANGRKMALPE